jgi:RNA polymerase sigma factor (TIGR02999 family)
MDSAPRDITQLLRAAQHGDRAAFDEVYRTLYDELHARARAVRRRQRSATFNTTALVHEAYLKLLPGPSTHVEDRSHFLAIAARAMRQVLVDAARKRSTAKRGSGMMPVHLDDAADIVQHPDAPGIQPDEILALDLALRQLEAWSSRQANVVECRVFAGLSVPETARALGISEPTVKRDWQSARAWLAHALGHS